jgi:hypothetical protein
MDMTIGHHTQKDSSGNLLHLIGLSGIKLDTHNVDAVFGACRKAFLEWKAQYDQQAVMLRASIRQDIPAQKEPLRAFLQLWNQDADVQKASPASIELSLLGLEGEIHYRISNRQQQPVRSNLLEWIDE